MEQMQASWKKSLPNLITFSRILFIPFIIYYMLEPSLVHGLIAAGLFIVASISDFLDGYFARKYNVESFLGKFLDPVCDKLLVSSILIMLVYQDRLHPVIVILLLSRDTLIGGLRSAAAAENIVIAAGSLGKWKTAIQMVMMPAILIYENLWGIPFYEIGLAGIYISLFLSLISGWQYMRDFFQARGNRL
tara:strand:- start:313 stop:882 length:570 start_codon:yes stop_codon:yes gene_type:complete